MISALRGSRERVARSVRYVSKETNATPVLTVTMETLAVSIFGSQLVKIVHNSTQFGPFYKFLS